MKYVVGIVGPALAAVAEEFEKLGYEVRLTAQPTGGSGISEHTLTVNMPGHRNFHYQVSPVDTPVPAFGARTMARGEDVYYRLEVFSQTGSEGYDIMGLAPQQLIDDVLDRYEAHLGFLQYSSDRDLSSIITPPLPSPRHGVDEAPRPQPSNDEESQI